MKLFWQNTKTQQEGQIELTGSVTIGRSPSNTVQILDPKLSRFHARIERKVAPDGSELFTVEDLGSRNGTFLNGKPIRKENLKAGDFVQIGDTYFCLGSPPRLEKTESQEAKRESTQQGEEPELVVHEPDGRIRRIALGQFPFTIGRKTSNSLKLKDLKASGHHARIIRRNGEFVLQDLDSTNGTFVNGERVKEVVLKRGDQITIGGTLLKVVLPRAPQHSEYQAWAVPERAQMEEVPATGQSLLVTLLSFAALIGIFWGGYGTATLLLRGGSKEIQEPGNLVGPCFSFEQGGETPEGWTPGPGALLRRVAGGLSPGKFKASLRFKEGKGEKWVWARLNERIPVTAGGKYLLQAFTSKKGKGVCCLSVVWHGERKIQRIDYSDLCPEGASRITSAVFGAPPLAQEAEIRLVGILPGEAFFDRVSFKQAEGESPDTLLSQGVYTVRMERTGAFDLLVREQPALRRVRLVTSTFPEGFPGQSLGAGTLLRVERSVQGDRIQATLARNVFDPELGEWFPLYEEVKLDAGGGTVTWILPLAWARKAKLVAYAFFLPSEVSSAQKRFILYGPYGRKKVSSEGLSGAVLQELKICNLGSEDLVLSFPSTGTLVGSEGQFFLTLEKELEIRPKEEKVAFKVSWSRYSDWEIHSAEEALKQAKEFVEKLQEGRAVSLLNQALKEYRLPGRIRKSLEEVVAECEQRATSILKQAEAMRKDLALKGGREVVEALKDLISLLRGRFQGIDFVQKAVSELSLSVNSFVQTVAESEKSSNVSQVLQKAKRLFEKNQLASAYVLCSELLREKNLLSESLSREIQDLKAQIEAKLRSKAALPRIPFEKER